MNYNSPFASDAEPMTQQQRAAPPLSPVLLAGFVLRPLSPVLLQPLLDAAMAAIKRRHPGVFDRLSGLDRPLFLIDPTDLPFAFILDPDPQEPSLRALNKDDAGDRKTSAVIRGPLMVMIDLLEGRIDGDALFFSRELMIEGDTEAVVALRNAVDGAEIDVVGDMLSLIGPFAAPARRAAGLAGGIFARAAEDLEALRAAVIAPAMRDRKAQADRMNKLEEKVRELSHPRRRTGLKKA